MKTRSIPLLLACAGFVISQPSQREHPGTLPDGSFLLNSGWKIKPSGAQISVDTFPMSALFSADGKYLLVLNGGYNPPSISVIDFATSKEIGRTPVPDGWLGLTMSKAGDRVYVGGGSRAAVFEFTFANGKLTPSRQFPVVAANKKTDQDFVGDVQLAPDGHLLYATNLYRNSVVVINPQSGLVISTIKTGRRPYRILFHPSGNSFYVSSWTDGSIGQYSTSDGSQIASYRVAPHTTDMAWVDGGVEDHPSVTARLFVSASNTNNVYVLGATETGELSLLETVNLTITPRQPAGSTPSGLGLSADKKKLFVACADLNAAAVVDISGPRSAVLGFVPTGWYPTTAFGTPDGRMGVLNGRGLRSYPNPGGPNPMKRTETAYQGTKAVEYVAHIQTGTVQLTDVSAEAMPAYTKQVLQNSAYNDAKLDDPVVAPDNPVRTNGPIKHVIYVVKENRTYDQVLGDMKEGNGDASLVLFGENITPNLHKIARDFVLLDNFYVNSDVSADGHNWATAAIAPDYTQRMWPNSYASRRKTYDYEGQEPTNIPPAGYIWTGAGQAGVTIRNYGYWSQNRDPAPRAGADQIAKVRDPILAPVTDMKYRGFDLDYSDMDRAKEFIADLRRFEQAGSMPQLMLVRMGNDHTNGTTPGKRTPLALAADNDQGVGMIVEALSHSRFWNELAVFVIEDDAQNGPDHVDSHRSPCWVISPWVNRHTVNSTMYNQTSVLRTMEIILGLRPMTTYDAGARPMSAVFRASSSPEPYTLEKPRTSLEDRNPAHSATARRSMCMRFEDADEIDDDELNAILWAAIKGPDTPMPVPVRSGFAH